MRRIVGQCSQKDFAGIEHLAAIVEKPDQLDVTTLSNSQKFAFRFIQVAFRKEIEWREIRKVIKEVLFWGDGDNVHEIQIKFKQNSALLKEIETFKELWRKERR